MKAQVSVIISTYNRSKTLALALDSLLEQESPPNYEIIVVENNCSDNTREVIQSYIRRDARIRYIFEKKQGLSYGRNAGIRAASSDILAFTDDDVCVSRDWVAKIAASAQKHPECGILGGKVLPLWPRTPPPWLTEEHWGPLALVDYGRPQTISSYNRKTLIGANMIIRRKVFDQVGLFATDYQRVKDGVGSTEDQELEDRYWARGGIGHFDPNLVVRADVQPERLRKSYHRRWHFRHGMMLARMRDPVVEGSGAALLGIPTYMFGDCGRAAWSGVSAAIAGKPDVAFLCEVKILFYLGFMRERLRQTQREQVAGPEFKHAD